MSADFFPQGKDDLVLLLPRAILNCFAPSARMPRLFSHSWLAKVHAFGLLLASEVCLWTMLAPIATVNVNAMEPHLRSQAQV